MFAKTKTNSKHKDPDYYIQKAEFRLLLKYLKKYCEYFTAL